ncbi:GDP-mannose 4,6-dehydratase [Prochlorococcus sp. AH-736-N17]|nr:GDP-mannose 4,6-dehydratase [Prochlorococcus sp. AH-736-N17]MDA9729199.1 GDP-mannose 4,6-dehydratase [Prochlorococcus sp. AH-736-N17]
MESNKYTILVTGAAGFIGAAVSKKLITNGHKVVGIDNINEYYDKNLKFNRLKDISKSLKKNSNNWYFEKGDMENKELLNQIFFKYKPKVVLNLGAQAGVRYSLENPEKFVSSNILGFSNILDACKSFEIENLIYASSSSVYGGNKKLPFKEDDAVNHPISFYAATKKSNELMAHAYSHIFKLPCTGLRFFTVYGPWGRPDMAPMIFAKCIYNQQPIDVFNHGKMKRDFTYIDDVVEAIVRCCHKPATSDDNFDPNIPKASTSLAPHRIFNVGNSQSVELLEFIRILEQEIGMKSIKNYKNIQPGDVVETASNINKLQKWINFSPSTSIEEGVYLFIKWFKKYYLI